MTILILGGTSEASELVSLLEDRTHLRAILSLAGRTKNPVLPHIPYRIGGFGGAEGLAKYIRENNITSIICATHPFSRQMPFNAYEAAKITGIPIIYLLRPEWSPQDGDNWLRVTTHSEALKQISDAKNIFLTVGRLEIAAYKNAPQHFYLVRTIDELLEKPLQNAVYLAQRPPFTVDTEIALMRKHKIDVVITKNSGGEATKAKLLAAHELAIPVILIKRPPRPDALHVQTADEAIKWAIEQNDFVL